MADQAHARTAANLDDDNAEWRPYQVWASQIRSDHRDPSPSNPGQANRTTQAWDPFQVWKRHVQQANTKKPQTEG
ncbi:MAG: hypothetical protein AAFU65_03570 [Pseudomonadota bacterium]